MDSLESILLGVVQGLTEFLPVSSTGHLILFKEALGVPNRNLQFEVVVHLGSLLAVIIIFRKKIGELIKGIFVGKILWKKGRVHFKNKNTRLLLLLLLASIPALVIGFFFEAFIEKYFLSPLPVGIFLIITGLVLFGTKFIIPAPHVRLNWRRSIIIGCAQALAIMPGISRSGATISVGIYCGITKKTATEFSFLLSIPLILGAGIFKIGKMLKTSIPESETMTLFWGSLAAMVSGYIAIRFLLREISKGHLYYFAYYCWLAGLVVVCRCYFLSLVLSRG